jgi:hypothetical protein
MPYADINIGMYFEEHGIGLLDPAILESGHPEYARVFAACHDPAVARTCCTSSRQ